LEEFKENNFITLNTKKDLYDVTNTMNQENVEMKDDLLKDVKNEGVVYEEITKRQRKFKLQGHTDSIFSISISPDKKYIVSGSYDETIRLWSIHTKNTLVVYKGHFAPVLCVKFSPFS
jgi:WD40 repeat protein